MKKVLVLGLVAGTVGILATATVVTAWGGIRALRRPASESTVVQGLGRQGNRVDEADDHVALAGAGRGYGRAAGAGESGQASPVEASRGGGWARDESPESAERAQGGLENEVHETVTLRGHVLVSPDSGSDLVIQTPEGEEIQVGTGPGWMAAQGFVLTVGDELTPLGFCEDGEFKASEISRESDGATITLRDASGRPAWAGQGRRANAAQNGELGSGSLQGEGQSRGDGNGQGRGRSRAF